MGRATPSPKLMIATTTVAAILTILASTCMARNNVLLTGEQLSEGQFLNTERYKFIMQDDCNLVLYKYSRAIWASNTMVTGKHGCKAVMQADGNFVIYDASGSAVWASDSQIVDGKYVLALQEDGNIVICGPDIWSTSTHKRVNGAVLRAMNGTVYRGSVIGPVIVNQNNGTAIPKVIAAAA